MAADRGPKLLYELKNETVTAGAVIATGIKPFVAGRACTILVDFTNTTNPTTSGAVASVWKLLVAYSTARSLYMLLFGKSKNSGSYQKGGFQESLSSAEAFSSSNPSAGRHRVAFTHEADSASATFKYRKGTGTIVSYTRTKDSFIADSTNLFIGGGVDNEASLPDGTIRLAQVWDCVLSDAEINAFLS